MITPEKEDVFSMKFSVSIDITKVKEGSNK